jgi:hypothetical protein
VVFKEIAAEFIAQFARSFNQPGVALPTLWVEQFLFLLLRQALLGAGSFFVFSLLLVAAPVGKANLQRRRNLVELC